MYSLTLTDFTNKGKHIKQNIKELESKIESIENELISNVSKLPNDTHPDVPDGIN